MIEKFIPWKNKKPGDISHQELPTQQAETQSELVGSNNTLLTETPVIHPAELDQEPDIPHRTPSKSRAEKWKTIAKVAVPAAVVGAAAVLAGREAYKNDRVREKVAAVFHPKNEKEDTGKDGNVKDLAKFTARTAVAGFAGTGADALAVTLDEHRAKTHRSVSLHPLLTKAIEFSRRTYGGRDPRVWPDVHIDHHALADINLFPFMEVSRALDWYDRQDEKPFPLVVPEKIAHLDPQAPPIDTNKVRDYGAMAEEMVGEKLGDLYVPPGEYTQQDLVHLLYPDRPDYYYPKHRWRKKRSDYTNDDLAKIISVDPHSPLYADNTGLNGVKQIFLTGTFNYGTAAGARKAFPEMISPHLDGHGEPAERVWPAVTAGILIPAGAIFAARGEYTTAGAAKAIYGGAVWDGARGLGNAIGSMAVNGLGHGGEDMDEHTVVNAAVGKKFEIKPDENGQNATNIQGRGLVPLFMKVFTAEEVTNQRYHHLRPDMPEYTDKTGWEGFKEAPWGSTVAWLARSRFPLIQLGDNFNLEPGQRRPDEPHPAAVLIYELRSPE